MGIPEFTIIIPHKDIPELLLRCINSIPKRDDIQICVVDDGSKDADRYSAIYAELRLPNVEFYQTKERRGAGYVRNVGLDHAKGRWLIFADADDIFTEHFNEILDIVKDDKSNDIIYYDVISRNSDTFEETTEAEFISNKINNIVKEGVNGQNKYGILTPWAKAVRHSLIKEHNIRFEEVPCSNDTAFSTYASFYAKHAIALPLVGYCWMQRPGSLWRKKNYSWYITRMEVMTRLAIFLKKNNEKEGYQYFKSSAEHFMNGLANISKVQHVKANIIYALMTKDYGKFFNHIPKLILHYARIL